MANTTHLKNINNKRLKLEHERYKITREIEKLFTKRRAIDKQVLELHDREFFIDTGKTSDTKEPVDVDRVEQVAEMERAVKAVKAVNETVKKLVMQQNEKKGEQIMTKLFFHSVACDRIKNIDSKCSTQKT
jgi:hypothetical protein